MIKKFALYSLLATLAMTAACPANATIRIGLSADVSSANVSVVLTGESTATSQQSLQTMGWEFIPTQYDPFPPAIIGQNLGMYLFTSGSATLENTTRGWSIEVPGIWMQDASNSPNPGFERFGFLTFDSFELEIDDVLRIDGNAKISLEAAGLVLGDLTAGSTGSICQLGLCGELQISTVPEPTAATMLIFGLALGVRKLVGRRRVAN